MDRKMMSLGRAKKKLRYFQPEERTSCQLKIRDVFSMRDLDNIFDDLDSEPGTPLLSPLPRSPGLDEHNKGSHSPAPKSLLAFRGNISPLKGSDVLAAEAAVQMDHLNDKGSPLEEIAPIKTSSPIELLAVEGVAKGAEMKETSPLLFGIEDEEPVVGDLTKLQTNPRSEYSKELSQGDSESLVSPPARLDFRKPTKDQDDLVKSLTPLKAPETLQEVCKTSAPAPEERLQTARHLSLSPIILIQKRQPEPLPEKQPIKQVQEGAVEAGFKHTLFQKKLRNSLQPKTSCFGKQDTLKQPARAPSPHEEDFMILEDDSPIRFTIPRKPEIKEKPSAERVPVEPHSKGNASPKQAKEAENHNDEPTKKTKAKRAKSSDVETKDPVVQSATEEREVEVTKDVRGAEQICLSPDTIQDADIPVAGKQRPKGKTSKSERHGSKDGNDGGVPAEKPTVKTKKFVPAKQLELHSTVNKANKVPASKLQGKVKKTGKTKAILAITEILLPEPDVSAASKRRRKPPGEWWLAQHDESITQEQQEAVQPSHELKSNKKAKKKTPVLTDSAEKQSACSTSQTIPDELVTVQKMPKTLKKSRVEKSQSNPAGSRKNPNSAGGRRKRKSGAQDQREMVGPALVVEGVVSDNEASGQLSAVACSQNPRQRNETPGDRSVFDKTYTLDCQSGSARKCPSPLDDVLEGVPAKRQRNPLWNWWEVPQSQEPVESRRSPPHSSKQTSRAQKSPSQSASHKMASLKKAAGHGQKKKQINMTDTPKSVKRSLATFEAAYNSAKPGRPTQGGQGAWQKGRRNLLHSLEDQSEQSTDNIHSDPQQQAGSHTTFDVCVSRESSTATRETNPLAPSGSNRASDYDVPFRSGPSSLIELERYVECDDVDLQSTRIIPQTRTTPRVLSDCDICGPPLKPIVLDNEDWDNLCVWFTHIWPTTSKDGKRISPDDFHWHSHAGRAMGHMIDLQNNMFSSGKILLGSYMKKPAQMDLDAVTVFNVSSSCVRVEIDGAKQVYNSGQTFMTPCGQPYSIHNMCQEPSILWYYRALPSHAAN